MENGKSFIRHCKAFAISDSLVRSENAHKKSMILIIICSVREDHNKSTWKNISRTTKIFLWLCEKYFQLFDDTKTRCKLSKEKEEKTIEIEFKENQHFQSREIFFTLQRFSFSFQFLLFFGEKEKLLI